VNSAGDCVAGTYGWNAGAAVRVVTGVAMERDISTAFLL
jgi:hypothetical protein